VQEDNREPVQLMDDVNALIYAVKKFQEELH
jgi:hypothetical protein